MEAQLAGVILRENRRFIKQPKKGHERHRKALTMQVNEERLHGLVNQVIREGGFSSVRHAVETPFNLVLEARKS